MKNHPVPAAGKRDEIEIIWQGVVLLAAVQSAQTKHGSTNGKAAEQCDCAWLRNCRSQRAEGERVRANEARDVGERRSARAHERQARDEPCLEASAVG